MQKYASITANIYFTRIIVYLRILNTALVILFLMIINFQ